MNISNELVDWIHAYRAQKSVWTGIKAVEYKFPLNSNE